MLTFMKDGKSTKRTLDLSIESIGSVDMFGSLMCNSSQYLNVWLPAMSQQCYLKN